jgi:formylmethanofuran dehydrogenase subunit E
MAIDLLKRTGNLKLVQRKLGHTSISTTENLYANLSCKDKPLKVQGINVRCDACNKVINGQGKKIDSGQVLCNDCLTYFR